MKFVQEANVPILPFMGQDLRDPRLCYRVRCPRPFPADQTVTDQFGTRGIGKLVPRLVCTPAIEGEAPTTSTTAPDQAVGRFLQCYKAKDGLRLRGTVSIETTQYAYGPCKLSPAKLFCVPGSVTVREANVSPTREIGGSTLDDDRLCYRVTCPRSPASIFAARSITDPFGTRTLGGATPRMLCGPAAKGTFVSTTTTTTSTTSTTFPPGTDPPLACQRAIEAGGMNYAHEVLVAISDCAAPGGSQSLSACLAAAPATSRINAALTQWRADATPPCASTDPKAHLGYDELCGAAPSLCTAPSVGVGGANDVIACLACRIKETLQNAGTKLFANQPERNACHGAIGAGGLQALRSLLDQTNGCLQQPGATSVAACFTPDLAMWRSQAEVGCMNVDPFTNPGYPHLCTGDAPVSPGFCSLHAKPCSFHSTNKLSGVGGEDDLLDCMTCQIEEAVLAIGRDLHGAQLCCTGGSCRDVLGRFACRNGGGHPARYRIDSHPLGSSGSAHGISVGSDGSLYLADDACNCIKKVSPTGMVTVLASSPEVPGFPTGVAADAAGNVYFSNRCGHQVRRIAPGGAVTVVAGTGTAGSWGDGGPATAARLVAPNRVVVGAGGKLYITESSTLGIICGVSGVASERIRMVDTSGIIHTVVGQAAGGDAGNGGPGLATSISGPYSLWGTLDGDIVFGEVGGQHALRYDPVADVVTRLAGRFLGPVASHSGYGGPAARARFYQNCGVTEDPDGNVIIGPMEDNRIALVDRNGSVIGIAGTGEGADGGPAGDGGLALLAKAGCPEDVAAAPDGRIYFSDLQSSRIRVLTRELY